MLPGKASALNATKNTSYRSNSSNSTALICSLPHHSLVNESKSPCYSHNDAKYKVHHFRIARSQSDASTFSSKPPSGLLHHNFTKFEEKKRHNLEVQSAAVKNLFKKSPKLPSPKFRDKRALSPESQSATSDLSQYLQMVPPTAAHHVYGFLKVSVEKLDRLISSGVLSPMEISDRIHSIYQNLDDKLRNNSAFSGNQLIINYLKLF